MGMRLMTTTSIDSEPMEMSGVMSGGLTWHWVQGQGMAIYRKDDPIIVVVWAGGKVRMKHRKGGLVTLEQKFEIGKLAAQCMEAERPLVEEMRKIAANYARMTLSDAAKGVTLEDIDYFLSDDNPVYYNALMKCITLIRDKFNLWDEAGDWDEAFGLYSNVYTYADDIELCMINTLRPYFAFEFEIEEPDFDED